MALLRRQHVSFEIFDDQSPTLWGSFVGNWTRYSVDGYDNRTATTTLTPGASLSFTFSGSQAWLYGGLSSVTGANGQILSYPTAEYHVNGVSAGSQQPWVDHNGAIVYFETPKLADGTHKIDVTVTTANSTDQYIVDYFLISPIEGGSGGGVTTRSAPSPTPTSSTPLATNVNSTPVGAIVGGVVGSVFGIVFLIIALWYILKKRSRGQAYYFEKRNPADLLAAEAHVEPYATHAPSSTGFSGQGPLSVQSDGSSGQPLSPSVGQTVVSGSSNITGPTSVTGTTTQPKTGKAALIAQQYQDVEQPVQLEDSGVRFNKTGEQGAGPSQLPSEVPPSYTAG